MKIEIKDEWVEKLSARGYKMTEGSFPHVFFEQLIQMSAEIDQRGAVYYKDFVICTKEHYNSADIWKSEQNESFARTANENLRLFKTLAMNMFKLEEKK